MKTSQILLLVFLFFTLSLSTIYGCSCEGTPTFCSYAHEDQTFVTAKILQHHQGITPDGFPIFTFMDVLVIERINGVDIRDTISILGEDGTSCGIDLFRFQGGATWLFKLRNVDATRYNEELEGTLYGMNACDISALPIEDGFIVGLIAPEVERMTITDFKENLDQCFLIVNSSIATRSGFSFSVYPNPVTTFVEVRKELTRLGVENGPTQIRMVRASGEVVGEQEVTEQDLTFKIDLSTYEAGVYFLMFYTQNTVVSSRIIKL